MSAPFCVVVDSEGTYDEPEVYGPFDEDEARLFEARYGERFFGDTSRMTFVAKPLLGLSRPPHAL